jgi:hypothetical protein
MGKLINAAGVPFSNINDFETSPLPEIFDRSFNFCQVNLTDHSQEYQKQSAAFYFGNSYKANAVA